MTPDPNSGEAWPLYPTHRHAVAIDGGPSSYRQRRYEWPCCGQHERRDETYGHSNTPDCAGPIPSRLADLWRKRAAYLMAGHRLDWMNADPLVVVGAVEAA